MKAKSDPIFPLEETNFSRLSLDQLKQNDLRVVFETLMTEPSHRTIVDINNLVKIMVNLTPIKKLRNSSMVYHLCRSMFIAKFKEKAFIYQHQEEAQSIYIILNGKVGLYKRNPQSEEQQQVIFLSEGSSFGHAYKWKQKFLPLTFEETLLAVIPKRQLIKIALKLSQEKQEIIQTLARVKIFGTVQMLRLISSSLNLHRVPFGNFIVKEGEIPKGLFFVFKGTVSKRLSINKTHSSSKEKEELQVTQYSVGDYFPKQKLSECLPFSIVAQSPCQIVSIPKSCLRLLPWSPLSFEQFKGEKYYQSQLKKHNDWEQYKQSYLEQNFHLKSNKLKPMIF